ncbi:hypothetical protein M407DRAFT_33857 [Tulasnella calospora MUT 4182]|uniref:Uncharacterized protein n=1 Tax=Tulasnella calospora MUT 4182 TaxID=1051891 RepID=A0A0C3Q1M5_9AGAM|nr:hypothetical protein M407DRAFT_33857 [Tulasnella calospora MUT 4182]
MRFSFIALLAVALTLVSASPVPEDATARSTEGKRDPEACPPWNPGCGGWWQRTPVKDRPDCFLLAITALAFPENLSLTAHDKLPLKFLEQVAEDPKYAVAVPEDRGRAI